jgi:hypothetical protein
MYDLKTILLVEDNPHDVELTLEALAEQPGQPGDLSKRWRRSNGLS